ncbi:MAG: TIGR00730 family Rossman fold protein [Planctomycetaceae bacterium]|nr:TIGR00730 family Rossman fold protein [Planctomycetaceae bacterium]
MTESEEVLAEKVQHLLISPSYQIAYKDNDYIEGNACRSARLALEYTKTEWTMNQLGIKSTIIVFGSARTLPNDKAAQKLEEVRKLAAAAPQDFSLADKLKKAEKALEMSKYYEQAREFGRLVSEENQAHPIENDGQFEYVICTGGGPGIMEAANRGAYEADALNIGLNIKLPYEQRPNPYISPPLCFQFHYFAIRKLHFLLRAKALVVFPGGYGTFDEMFEALTLRQTGRMQPIPVILFGEDFWRRCINFNVLVEDGVIDRKDLELFYFTESPQEAWNIIKHFHENG